MVHAVSDSTLRKYLPAVQAFLECMKIKGEQLETPEQVDWALARHLDDLCYQQRRGFHVGSALYSGLTALFPEMRGRLPRSARSLMAWQRLHVEREGGPIPLEAIVVVAAEMVAAGESGAALATLMAEDGYLRESDWAGICTEDLAVSPSAQGVGAVLGEPGRGESTKTGAAQGVVFETEFLCCWLAQLKKDLPPKARVVPLSPDTYRKIWKRVLGALGVELGPPHSLRHSRPSAECLYGTRSLEGVRRRGRWASLKSVQRYTKSHLLLRAQAGLPGELAVRGAAILDNPAKHFAAALRRSPTEGHGNPWEAALRRICATSRMSYAAGRDQRSKIGIDEGGVESDHDEKEKESVTEKGVKQQKKKRC